MEIPSEKLFGNIGKHIELYPHQASAAQWMKMIEYNVGNPSLLKGGILADDTGMGKTKTVAAVIASTPVPSTLILCLPSTRYAWIEAILDAVNNMNVYTFEQGKYYKCRIVVNSEGVEIVEQIPLDKRRGEEYVEPAILICNYQLVTHGTVNDRAITDKIWYRIVVDEAHFLRNITESWQKLNNIKQPYINTNGVNHRFGTRWCVTATPIHMGKSDLVNILKFIDDRFLKGSSEKEWNNELNQLISTNLFRRNRNQLTPFMKKFMRYPENEPIIHDVRLSLKETVLSGIIENMSYEQLVHAAQRDVNFAEAILNDEKAFLIAKTTEARHQNSRSQYGNFVESEDFRNMISYPFGSNPSFLSGLVRPDARYRGTMTKINALKKTLSDHFNKSFVIFYHYSNIGNKLEEDLKREYPNYVVLKIDGNVTDREKYNIRKLADHLIGQNKQVILLSSTMATSEGLNYQKFYMMIIYDPEYNHQTDLQVKGRIQRIGQKNQVEIFEISLDDFKGPYGIISVDRRIQAIRDERSHLSDIIDNFNAAFTFRRYYFKNQDGVVESGVNFGDYFESLPQGSINGPNSVGQLFIK